MKHILPLLIVASVWSSCSQDPTEVYYEDDRNYYDLPSCMRHQVDALTKMGKHVRKKLTKDGQSQVVEKGDVNWQEELELFLESDINRPAWRGSFKTDTVHLDQMLVITYKTENAEIPVKNVVVTLDKQNKQCLRLTIDRQTDNFLYSSLQKLFFTPGEGYTVKGQLKVLFLFESEYAVESTFIDG